MKHRFLKMAEMENKNPYLIRRLEESSGYFGKSFSSRYSDWKRSYSIRNAFYRELTTISFKEPIKVLDLGCGDGWLTYRLKAEFSKKYKLKFFGVDLSQLDIEFANHRKRYFHHKDCYFQVMDAQYLGFDVEILKNEGFKITSIKGTSGFLFGSPYLDNYRILFAITVILDTLLEKLPLSYL